MHFLKRLTFLSVLVVLSAENVKCDDFPTSIERCKFEDYECLVKSWNKYMKFAGNPNGIPELNVPDTHNFHMATASISPGEGPLDIKLTMRNITLTGFDVATVDRVVGFPKDPKQMTQFQIFAHGPFIRISGRYNVSGKILLLPVAGDDEGDVKFDNVKLNVTAYTSTKMIDGKEYLDITKVSCSYDSDRNHYRFENLLNNKEISDSINAILNDNQDVLNNELKPPIRKVLSRTFKKLFVDALTKYPYNSYFVDA